MVALLMLGMILVALTLDVLIHAVIGYRARAVDKTQQFTSLPQEQHLINAIAQAGVAQPKPVDLSVHDRVESKAAHRSMQRPS